MPWATLKELAELTDAAVVGDASTRISNALPLQDVVADCITLVDHPKHAAEFLKSAATAVVTENALEGCDKPQLVVKSLHEGFIKILQHFRPQSSSTPHGVLEGAHVDASAKIGTDTTIHPGATVGSNVTIGDNCVLHSGAHVMSNCRLGDACTLMPGATLYDSTQLGNRVTIHASTTLGAHGFGYRKVDRKHVATGQFGWVQVGDDVEVGANSCIDRGTYGPTRIGEGTKIDNLVQIGHNCHIGRHNIICAHVGIAGSASTGDYVVLAGQVGVRDHSNLGDRVVVGAQAGVICDIEDDATFFGTPAIPRKRKLQEVVMVSRLPEMRSDVKKLKKQLLALTEQMSQLQEPDSQNQRGAA